MPKINLKYHQSARNVPIIPKRSIKCQKFFQWLIFGTPWHFCVLYGDFRQPWAILSPKMSNKANNAKNYKINVCTLETQMSKYKGDFKSKGNPKIRIKTPVRTKLKKSSFLETLYFLSLSSTWMFPIVFNLLPLYLLGTQDVTGFSYILHHNLWHKNIV